MNTDEMNNQQLFNFLHPKLCPSITCHTAATENYEVGNLISENPFKKSLGFIAYPTTKPPVEIEFNFICPIDVHYISLRATVGSQKTTGIKLLAKSNLMEYIQISKSVILNLSGIVFCDNRRYSNDDTHPNFDPFNNHVDYFNRSCKSILSEMTSLKVVIFRTEKSVPCLGGIEVWGTPAETCSTVTKRTIQNIMRKQEIQSTRESNEFHIPDDFKDELTYEIMSLPVTLPSGKTIDQLTLDKHIKNEEQFGRKPCDPFTGVKFTENLKPILNVALKSRIDMFVMQNQHRPELSNILDTKILGGNKHKNNARTSGEISLVMKSSLETDIEKIKKSSNFINVTNTLNNGLCIKCKITNYFLYKIPCQHFYCRQCLIMICTNSECFICREAFTSKDIEKINI